MALRPLNPRSQRYIRFPRRRSRLVPLLLWFGMFCLTVWVFYSIINFFVGNEDPTTHLAEDSHEEIIATPQGQTPTPQFAPQSNAEVVALAAHQYRKQNSTLPGETTITNLNAAPQTVASAEPQHKAGILPLSPSGNAPQMTKGMAPRALHNGVSWNIPYVGFRLDEIAASIQQKYPAIRAGQLEFQPEGVYTTIPNLSSLPDKSIALTINGCGPFGAGESLFSLLKRERIPTTFFLSSTWIVKHKKDFSVLEKEPLFSIQAHGKKHIPLSLRGESAKGVKGTDSLTAILHEVEGNARDIQRLTNKRPHWFRGAFGVYDREVMRIVSQELNLPLAGYSMDANASTTEGMVTNLLKAKHGDIIMLQFTNGKQLTEALATAIPRLKSQGFVFVSLALPQKKK